MWKSAQAIDPNKVAVYIRWSTEEQGQGTTLEVQKEACAHFCRSQGWHFREDLLFIDDGYSAGDLNRPALTRLREAVRAGQVECVVVYKLDRLSRNLLDCVALVREEWAGRCALFSTKENFDTQSPVGQMIFNILVSFAEFERNLIRERTLSGKRKRAEQGRNAGQRYPYGYKKASGGGWALDDWDEATGRLMGPAAVVRRIFDEYLAGAGTVTIARRLNEAGIPGPLGGRWRPGAVARILGNPLYAGRYEYGRRRRPGPAGSGAAAPGDAPILAAAPGAAPAIVTEAEFAAVQRLRQQRARTPPHALHSPFLLSGVAQCGLCGSPICGTRGKGRRYYVCAARARGRGCPALWVPAAALEQVVEHELRSLLGGLDGAEAVQELAAELNRRLAEHDHAVAAARAQVAALERKCRRLEEGLLLGELDPATWQPRRCQLEAGLAAAREALARAKAAREGVRAAGLDPGALAALAREVDPWSELALEERKELVRAAAALIRVVRCRSRGRAVLTVEWQPRVGPAIPQAR